MRRLMLTLFLSCGRVALLDDAPDAGGVAGGSAGGATAGGASSGGVAGGSTAGGSAGGSTAGGAAGGSSAGGNTGGGTAGGSSGCTGLGIEACRANTQCEADFCIVCTCTPTFMGCRARTARPAECPLVDCVEPRCCADDASCGRPTTCLPESRPVCGICDNAPSTCTSDLSCDPGQICDARPCACQGQTECRPGCSLQNPCPAGQACGSDNRCAARLCGPGQACPSGFRCELGPAGDVCVARACSRDRDCGELFCVSGTCAPSLGVCRLPRP